MNSTSDTTSHATSGIEDESLDVNPPYRTGHPGHRAGGVPRDSPGRSLAGRPQSRPFPDCAPQVLISRRFPSGLVAGSDEGEAKAWLRHAGMPAPAGRDADGREAPDAAAEIGFPVAVKILSDRLPHKIEAGAVVLRLSNREGAEDAVARVRAAVRRHDAGALSDRFLVEETIEQPLAEILAGVRTDPRFGLAMTLGSGACWRSWWPTRSRS